MWTRKVVIECWNLTWIKKLVCKGQSKKPGFWVAARSADLPRNRVYPIIYASPWKIVRKPGSSASRDRPTIPETGFLRQFTPPHEIVWRNPVSEARAIEDFWFWRTDSPRCFCWVPLENLAVIIAIESSFWGGGAISIKHPSDWTDEKVYQEVGQITCQFHLLECADCAKAVIGWLRDRGIEGKILRLRTRYGEDYILSDRFGQ